MVVIIREAAAVHRIREDIIRMLLRIIDMGCIGNVISLKQIDIVSGRHCSHRGIDGYKLNNSKLIIELWLNPTRQELKQFTYE
jgi:hypothetical protein